MTITLWYRMDYRRPRIEKRTSFLLKSHMSYIHTKNFKILENSCRKLSQAMFESLRQWLIRRTNQSYFLQNAIIQLFSKNNEIFLSTRFNIASSFVKLVLHNFVDCFLLKMDVYEREIFKPPKNCQSLSISFLQI